jgi:F-box-like
VRPISAVEGEYLSLVRFSKVLKGTQHDEMDHSPTSISLFDKHIASLQNKIRQLSNDRNAILPISRLPVEVLSEIFLVLAALIPYEEAKKRPGWIAITYVCQRWRAAALGCLRLWSSISLTHLCDDWVLELLTRVRDAPMDLILRGHGSKHSSPIPLALLLASGGLAQVRSIDLVGCHGLNFAFEVFLEDLDTVENAPLLQDLHLEAPSEHIHIMPSNFMLRDTQRLRRISLSNWVPESWNSAFLNGLTHLKIHAANAPPASPLEFFSALERLAKITELDLNIRIPDMDKVVEGRHIISFQRMTSLKVGKRPVAEVVGLLRLIRIPHTSKIDIHCEFDTEDDTSIRQSLSVAFLGTSLSQIAFLHGSRDPAIKFLAVDYRYQPSPSATARFSFQEPAVGVPSKVSHHLQLYGGGKIRALSCILEGLPLSELRFLGTDSITLPHPWLRENSVQQFSHLHTVAISGMEACRDFLAQTHASAFPALKYLRFLFIDFKYGSRRPDALDPASVTRLLKNRKDHGAKLKKLVFSRSGVYKKDRLKFKGLCDEIEFEED